MHPIFIEIGNFSIRYYGLMAALGFVAAFVIINLNRKFAGLSADQVANIVFIGIVGGIVGARMFYVFQNWSFYSRHWTAIVRVDQGGLVFYGGFILAAAALIVYGIRTKIDWVRTLDVIAPALAVAHAFGRIGCFLNGCCFGKPFDGFCAVRFPVGSEPFSRYAGAALHPVQLYEAGLNLILAVVLFRLVRRARRGVAMSVYLLAYGVLRFGDEFFRGDHRELVRGFTPAQCIGFLMIPLGLGALIWFLTRKEAADDGSQTSRP